MGLKPFEKFVIFLRHINVTAKDSAVSILGRLSFAVGFSQQRGAQSHLSLAHKCRQILIEFLRHMNVIAKDSASAIIGRLSFAVGFSQRIILIRRHKFNHANLCRFIQEYHRDVDQVDGIKIGATYFFGVT